MRSFYFHILLIFCSFTVNAQTACRPPIAMIDYSGHDDHFPNPDMDSIIAIHPDILIDNTSGGYWHGQCLPAVYSPYGVKVYSYVHGSYETYDSTTLISQIVAIALDGAYGVFLDEVSNAPNIHQKNYLLAMINKAHSNGLKIILNPGMSSFDTFLYRADYVLTDEHFSNRSISPSEAIIPSKVIVVNEGVTNAAAAAAVTDSARSKNFAYSYACADYMLIPSWIRMYMSLITHPTTTPVITVSGGILYSSAAYGNQWYSATSGVIPGATGSNFTPTGTGSFFDIVTQSGCVSGPSDTLEVLPTSFCTVMGSTDYLVYPIPANDVLQIDKAAGANLVLRNIFGVTLISQKLKSDNEVISLEGICHGIFFLEIRNGIESKLIKIAK